MIHFLKVIKCHYLNNSIHFPEKYYNIIIIDEKELEMVKKNDESKEEKELSEEEKNKLKERLHKDLLKTIDKYFLDIKQFDVFMLIEVLENVYFNYLESIRDQYYEDEEKGEEVYPFIDSWELTNLVIRLSECSTTGIEQTIGALETAKQIIFSEWNEIHKKAKPVLPKLESLKESENNPNFN